MTFIQSCSSQCSILPPPGRHDTLWRPCGLEAFNVLRAKLVYPGNPEEPHAEPNLCIEDCIESRVHDKLEVENGWSQSTSACSLSTALATPSLPQALCA